MPASGQLSVDFLQMPWSRSPASWQYHADTVWESLQKAVEPGDARLEVACPASANPYLDGHLVLEGGRFRASVTVTGPPESAPVTSEDLAKLRTGGHTQFLHGLDIAYSGGDHTLTVAIEAPLAGHGKDRMRDFLDAAWDLQLLAVRLVGRIFGEWAEEAASAPARVPEA